MDNTTCNLLIGNAELNPVCRSSEGKNQGKTFCIVLTSSSVRSAVYRSLPERKRGRKPFVSNLFFYALNGASNACCTRILLTSKQASASTFSGGNCCPNPYLCPVFNCSQTLDTFFLHFSLCHNVLDGKEGAISKVGRDLRVAYSKPHAISRLYVPVICKYNGRTLHVNNVL